MDGTLHPPRWLPPSLGSVGQHLWNAARVFATYLVEHDDFIRGKNVLELGAAGALPGVVAGLSGATKTVITDYPDQPLIDNIQYNVDANIPPSLRSNVHVLGHCWGAATTPMLECLSPTLDRKFDTIILSDLVFNHSQHTHLLKTCLSCSHPGTQLLVFYTHHRPKWVLEDRAFFLLAAKEGWSSELVVRERRL